MAKKKSRKKSETRDVNQMAHSVVAHIISQPSKDRKISVEVRKEKNPAAVALGRLGGLRGGHARARSLTSDQRKAIARKAAEARWKNKK